ncbi:MAG TPA: glycosyltransferase [Terriglobales bacterium]
MRPRIVLSGVNIREVGGLSVFRDALASLAREYGEQYEIVALVMRRDLFDIAGVTYLEFPRIMRSWLSRLRFEYWSSREISAQLKPKLWLSMHDMTPNVSAEIRAVYCQNPSPFYRATVSEFFLDWRFGLFTLFYRFLYRINIHANDYVIVQQDWMRTDMMRLYGLRNVVVAHPVVHLPNPVETLAVGAAERPYRFFYPSFPRTFKNPEVCLKAARILEGRGFDQFELWLTFDGSVNKYARQVVKEFADVRTVRWLGVLPRERVFDLYGETDCLLFPSRLETWGMPITEMRGYGRPILSADLAYAHESAAGYEKVRFFDPGDAEQLADLMHQAATAQPIFAKAPEAAIEEPYARNWSELWALLLAHISDVKLSN